MPKKKHNRRNKKGKGSNNANAASAPTRTDKSSINNVNREDSDDLVAEFMSNTDRALKEFDNLTDEEKQNRGEDMKKAMMEGLMKDMEGLLRYGIIDDNTDLLTDKQKRNAKLHDAALFKDHPPPDDCDICFNPLPLASNEMTYKFCCGKVICDGCIEVMRDNHTSGVGDLCPFCRVVSTRSNTVELVQKRMELGDPESFMLMGHIHSQGSYGQKKDLKKAVSLMVRGAELGSKDALGSLGNLYTHGLLGVEKDLGKGKHYLELAAMKGSVEARYALGCRENTEATVSRGVKHFIIGARAGHAPSLESVKKAFMMGYATKEEYEHSLRSYQKSHDSMKSKERDIARAVYTPTDDQDLFKDPPPRADCPICSLPLPSGQGSTYLVCCGKKLCGGCVYAMDVKDGFQRNYCGLCGTPGERSYDEHLKRFKNRMEKKDPEAYTLLGTYYMSGAVGLSKDPTKAHKLWMKAAEMGHANALGKVAHTYEEGLGVGANMKKARYYYELGCIKGDEFSRHNLGAMEQSDGNIDRAVKHWMISASRGAEESMELIGREFKEGNVTKDDYKKTLRAYNDSVKGMRSKEREKATQLREQGLGTSMPVDHM